MLERLGDELIVVRDIDTADFSLVRRLRRRHPEVPIVAYTMHTEPQALHALLDAGVAGIASTLDDFRDLERLCNRVLSGASSIVSKRIATCTDAVHTFNDTPRCTAKCASA